MKSSYSEVSHMYAKMRSFGTNPGAGLCDSCAVLQLKDDVRLLPVWPAGYSPVDEGRGGRSGKRRNICNIWFLFAALGSDSPSLCSHLE